MAHTEGEWTVEWSSGNWILYIGDERRALFLGEAEARLASAAPELLDACKALVAMLEHSMTDTVNADTGLPFRPGFDDLEITPDGSVKLSDARAAIAKATGAA